MFHLILVSGDAPLTTLGTVPQCRISVCFYHSSFIVVQEPLHIDRFTFSIVVQVFPIGDVRQYFIFSKLFYSRRRRSARVRHPTLCHASKNTNKIRVGCHLVEGRHFEVGNAGSFGEALEPFVEISSVISLCSH